MLLIRDLLRYQTNMDEHDPEICDDVNLWRNKSTNCYKIRPQLTAPGAMVNYMLIIPSPTYWKAPLPIHLLK